MPDGRIGGYYTLSAASVQLQDLPADTVRRLPRYPSCRLLLGRLAVDRRYQGHGWGRFLLVDALRRCVRSEIPGFAVVVDAIDENARRFYRRESFLSLPHSPNRLFRRISDLAGWSVKSRARSDLPGSVSPISGVERRAAACCRFALSRRDTLAEEMIMSGCIVGWAHSKFGKHEGRDIESLIVEVDAGGARRCRGRRRRHRRGLSRHDERRLRPPGISRPRWCSRPTPAFASSPRPGSRTPAPPARPRSIGAERDRRRQGRGWRSSSASRR